RRRGFAAIVWRSAVQRRGTRGYTSAPGLLPREFFQNRRLACRRVRRPSRSRGDSAVQRNVVAIEVAAEDFFVMGARSRLHVGGLEREMANDFLGRPPAPDFFFQVRKGLREEEGRDVRKETIVEPVAFVRADCLERRLIENKDRTGWHVP